MKVRCQSVSLFFISVVSIFVVQTAHASSEYQHLVGYKYITSDYENDFNIVANQLRLTAHLSSVDTANHPIQEAAFLQRVSRFDVAYINFDSSQKISGSPDLKFSGDQPVLQLTYMSPNSPIIAQAGWASGDLDAKSPYSGSSKSDLISLAVGRFISDSHIVAFRYAKMESDSKLTGFSSSNNQSTTWEVESKSVTENSDGTALNIEAGFAFIDYEFDGIGSDSGTNMEAYAQADYYHDRSTAFSAGMEMNWGDDEDDEGITFNIGAELFLNDSLSVGGSYEVFSADNATGEDEDTLSIEVKGWL